MRRVILVTGGARSGKSVFSETLAKEAGLRMAYIATAPVMDGEMAERVAKHRERRAAEGWTTIEEQTRLSEAISACSGKFDVILVDCLTLWINNLLYHAEQNKSELAEADMAHLCSELESACSAFGGTVIFVINEVGLGIVPDNPLSRRFRDLSGRCSQSVAKWADHVVLVCCGLPLYLKKN